MNQSKPATLYNDIAIEIAAIQQSQEYLDPSSFKAKKLLRDCRNLTKTNGAEGWTMLTAVHAVTGNIEEMFNAYSNTKKLWLEAEDILNCSTSLMFVGAYYEAFKLFAENITKLDSHISEAYLLVAHVGGLQLAAESIERARKMNLELPDNAQLLLEIARIAKKNDLSDQDMAKHIDAAGQILRKHQLVAKYGLEKNDIDGFFTGITMVLGVKSQPTEVFNLNFELAELEQSLQIPKNLAFDVVFSGNLI